MQTQARAKPAPADNGVASAAFVVTTFEQTVVLLARATAFTVVCQACEELDAAGEHTAHTAQGLLRLEHDLGWTSCPRGHRIRVIRAGAGVHAEPTSPLW